MKEELISYSKDVLDSYDVFIDDCFIDVEEGNKVFNVVVDCEKGIIDLDKITDVSRVLNKIIDEKLDLDVSYVDIYSKEKGEVIDE